MEEQSFEQRVKSAIKDFEQIEYQKRTWNSKFMREQDIWETIAFNLNSTTGKEHKHWSLVMDLYHKKYKQ
jgi:hypothetical protein